MEGGEAPPRRASVRVKVHSGQGALKLDRSNAPEQAERQSFHDWALVQAFADRVEPVPEEAIPGVCATQL